MTLKTGPIHKDVRASKPRNLLKSRAAHHTISWTSSHDGTTMLVKIFDASHIEMSLNGTFDMEAGELLEINDEIRKWLLQNGMQP